MNRFPSLFMSMIMTTSVASLAYGVQVTEIIDFPNADVVQARGINSAGDIVGYRTVADATESFVRTSSGFAFFQVDSADTFALGINDAGDTVGGVNTPLPGQDAFVRSAGGGTTSIQPLWLTDAAANGINNAGVVVGSGNPFATGGFLRATDASETSIDFPGEPGDVVLKTNATDINNNGLVVGHAIGQRGSDFFGSSWYNSDGGSTFTTVTIPGQAFTFVWGANDTGLLVGDYSDSLTGDRTGFVYNTADDTFIPFSAAGADWTVPTGINDAGEIAGFWRDASTGRVSGFVAVVPEPASLSLIAGLVGLGLAVRRQ